MAKGAKAYSYLRFSTPEQSQGDSFRRQTEAATAYAARNSLDLQELTFRDLGVSAFRGSNVIEGALGQFIAAVDSGKVKRGSYLLVENLDRLSRDRIMPALNRFSSLLEKGVNIVTLSDNKIYTSESLNNLPDLMLSLLVMSRAHEESELKSRRVKAAWQDKRGRAAEGGHILTSRAPAWLRVVNGAFEVRKDRAAVVRRIFALALAGHGKGSIAHRLNEDKVEPFGDGPAEARKANGWHPSYVQKILSNEAVIGRFQPMRRVWIDGKKQREADGPLLENYFPAILKNANDFHRIRRAPKGASGHKGAALSNILSGLVTCDRCGGKMHYINKGSGSRGGQYFACDTARRLKKCNAPSVRYHIVVGSIFNSLEAGEIDIRALLGETGKDRRPELMHKMEAMDGRIAETEASIANLLDALERRRSPNIEKRLEANEAALVKLREEKSQTEDELGATANGGDQVGDVIGALRTLNNVMQSGDQRAIGDVNVRLNATLKRIIAKIEIGMNDGAQKWFEQGIRWADRHTKGKALPSKSVRAVFDANMKAGKVSIGVAFKGDNRLLVIYSDPREPKRYIAGAVRTNAKGGIESFALKLATA